MARGAAAAAGLPRRQLKSFGCKRRTPSRRPVGPSLLECSPAPVRCRWYMPRDAEEFQAFRRAGSAPSSLCVRGARDPLASLADICTGSLCLIAPPTDTGRDVTP